MKPDTRHVIVGMITSVGVAFILGIIFGAWAFVAYAAFYLVAYSNFPATYKVIDRIANGKDKA